MLDVDRLATEMVNGCQILLEKQMGPLREQMAAAEARMTRLEEDQLRFSGTWQASAKYRRGDLVTHQGGLWFCCAASEGTRPGEASGGWQLAVKRGAAE
ncbi:hypothetical protein HB662_19830 [Roseomonas frigidaquae]|uniref:Carbohydrate binding domain-containing protein n=1 Tax=Falsiroseomonas frigidaquae TaxID=487318 RepID=A0ABX1F3W6_9PROT|nr:hypothetical protein [Falsiroseomonas frigidaquae]NKE47040.1 hypothetical protein [Falsiroseomonas frigidaquae]